MAPPFHVENKVALLNLKCEFLMSNSKVIEQVFLTLFISSTSLSISVRICDFANGVKAFLLLTSVKQLLNGGRMVLVEGFEMCIDMWSC